MIQWGRCFGYAATAVVTVSGLVLQGKEQPRKGPVIIAHVASQAVSAKHMNMRLEHGWEYLYVDGQDGSVTVVNVSHPAKPSVVRTSARGSVNMQQLGESLALVGDSGDGDTNGQPTTVQSTPSKKLRVVDTSDPSNPHPITELDGATAYALDRVRGLLFLSNAEGLWIVRDESLIDPSVKLWEQLSSAP